MKFDHGNLSSFLNSFDEDPKENFNRQDSILNENDKLKFKITAYTTNFLSILVKKIDKKENFNIHQFDIIENKIIENKIPSNTNNIVNKVGIYSDRKNNVQKKIVKILILTII